MWHWIIEFIIIYIYIYIYIYWSCLWRAGLLSHEWNRPSLWTVSRPKIISAQPDMRMYAMSRSDCVQSLFASHLSIYVDNMKTTTDTDVYAQLICLGFNSQNYDLKAIKKFLSRSRVWGVFGSTPQPKF